MRQQGSHIASASNTRISAAGRTTAAGQASGSHHDAGQAVNHELDSVEKVVPCPEDWIRVTPAARVEVVAYPNLAGGDPRVCCGSAPDR